MTNEQILIKVIKKAMDNGFVVGHNNENKGDLKIKECEGCHQILIISNGVYWDDGIIFYHDFAISFYGKEWKERLKEQVLEVNPLDYIRKYLD